MGTGNEASEAAGAARQGLLNPPVCSTRRVQPCGRFVQDSEYQPDLPAPARRRRCGVAAQSQKAAICSRVSTARVSMPTSLSGPPPVSLRSIAQTTTVARAPSARRAIVASRTAPPVVITSSISVIVLPVTRRLRPIGGFRRSWLACRRRSRAGRSATRPGSCRSPRRTGRDVGQSAGQLVQDGPEGVEAAASSSGAVLRVSRATAWMRLVAVARSVIIAAVLSSSVLTVAPSRCRSRSCRLPRWSGAARACC